MRQLTVLVAALVVPFTLASAQQPAARKLNVGAHVRVVVPKIDTVMLTGTVVAVPRTPTCVAIRVDHSDSEGRQQYAFLAGVTALEVDRRTNQGIQTLGLSPATADDWERWTAKEISTAASVCQRKRVS